MPAGKCARRQGVSADGQDGLHCLAHDLVVDIPLDVPGQTRPAIGLPPQTGRCVTGCPGLVRHLPEGRGLEVGIAHLDEEFVRDPAVTAIHKPDTAPAVYMPQAAAVMSRADAPAAADSSGRLRPDSVRNASALRVLSLRPRRRTTGVGSMGAIGIRTSGALARKSGRRPIPVPVGKGSAAAESRTHGTGNADPNAGPRRPAIGAGGRHRPQQSDHGGISLSDESSLRSKSLRVSGSYPFTAEPVADGPASLGRFPPRCPLRGRGERNPQGVVFSDLVISAP